MVVLSLGVAPKPISGWKRDVCCPWAVTIAPLGPELQAMKAVALDIPVWGRLMDVQPPKYFAALLEPVHVCRRARRCLGEVERPRVVGKVWLK